MESRPTAAQYTVLYVVVAKGNQSSIEEWTGSETPTDRPLSRIVLTHLEHASHAPCLDLIHLVAEFVSTPSHSPASYHVFSSI